MRHLLPLLLAACALLLSSCQWNIGDIIRSETAVHVGGDVRHPVDGKVYCDEDGNFYAWVPEVTYRTEPGIVEWVAMGPLPHKAFDITPTGRTILVRVDSGIRPSEKLESLPEGAKLFCLTRGEWPAPACVRKYAEPRADRPENMLDTWRSHYPERDHRWLGDFEGEKATRGSIGAQIAAAPFDFVIDPILSVVTTPVWFFGFFIYCACTGH